MLKTWQVQLLIFKDQDHEHRDTILVLVDDAEWLRAHHDAKTGKWVETKTAHYTGLQRNEQRTAKELASWLLASTSTRLTELIAKAIQNHFDTIDDRRKAAAAREQADELREKAAE